MHSLLHIVFLTNHAGYGHINKRRICEFSMWSNISFMPYYTILCPFECQRGGERCWQMIDRRHALEGVSNTKHGNGAGIVTLKFESVFDISRISFPPPFAADIVIGKTNMIGKRKQIHNWFEWYGGLDKYLEGPPIWEVKNTCRVQSKLYHIWISSIAIALMTCNWYSSNEDLQRHTPSFETEQWREKLIK